jgi:hypothetical protein
MNERSLLNAMAHDIQKEREDKCKGCHLRDNRVAGLKHEVSRLLDIIVKYKQDINDKI